MQYAAIITKVESLKVVQQLQNKNISDSLKHCYLETIEILSNSSIDIGSGVHSALKCLHICLENLLTDFFVVS